MWLSCYTYLFADAPFLTEELFLGSLTLCTVYCEQLEMIECNCGNADGASVSKMGAGRQAREGQKGRGIEIEEARTACRHTPSTMQCGGCGAHLEQLEQMCSPQALSKHACCHWQRWSH